MVNKKSFSTLYPPSRLIGLLVHGLIYAKGRPRELLSATLVLGVAGIVGIYLIMTADLILLFFSLVGAAIFIFCLPFILTNIKIPASAEDEDDSLSILGQRNGPEGYGTYVLGVRIFNDDE